MQALLACRNCGTAVDGDASYVYCWRCLIGFDFVDAEREAEKIAGIRGPVRFGDYELIEEIGYGRVGIVFKAWQISLNRAVALKMLFDPRLESPVAWRGFVMEAEAASRLYHSNILRIYDAWESDGHRFLTTPWICGENLGRKIARGEYEVPNGERPSSGGPHYVEEQIAGLMGTIAWALHYAHESNVMHGNLRPRKILIDYRGRPHLTDFGVARLSWRESSGVERIETGMIDPPIGQDYIPPEQTLDDPPNRATDIYSLGVILYGLLTGRLPFTEAKVWEMWRKKKNGDPDSPRRHNPSIDEELAAICLKCLRRDPARRYLTAGELARDLEHWCSAWASSYRRSARTVVCDQR